MELSKCLILMIVPLTPMQTSEIGGGWLVHHRQRSFFLRTRRLAWLYWFYPVYQGNNIVYKDSQYFRVTRFGVGGGDQPRCQRHSIEWQFHCTLEDWRWVSGIIHSYDSAVDTYANLITNEQIVLLNKLKNIKWIIKDKIYVSNFMKKEKTAWKNNWGYKNNIRTSMSLKSIILADLNEIHQHT